MRIKFNFEKYASNGLFAFIFVLLGIFVLSYILLHNPYKSLQKDIFETAENIRHYYRDQPGYWKLSTNSATENGLMKNLAKYKEYDIQIGQGIKGEAGLPSDLSFDITLQHLTKSACVKLSELKIPQDTKLILQKVTITNEDESLEFAWGEKNKLPFDKHATRNLCHAKENIITWTFQ